MNNYKSPQQRRNKWFNITLLGILIISFIINLRFIYTPLKYNKVIEKKQESTTTNLSNYFQNIMSRITTSSLEGITLKQKSKKQKARFYHFQDVVEYKDSNLNDNVIQEFPTPSNLFTHKREGQYIQQKIVENLSKGESRKKEVFKDHKDLHYSPFLGKKRNTQNNINDKILPPKVEINTSLNEVPNSTFLNKIPSVSLPTFTKGIYLTYSTANSNNKLKEYIIKAKKYDLNTFVIDVQPKIIKKENIEQLHKANIYSIARIVVFPTGLKTKYPPKEYLRKIFKLITLCKLRGFNEIQLDYIRYADKEINGDPNYTVQEIPLKEKYQVVNSLLNSISQLTDRLKLQLSADVFGRITLNRNDPIGQKLENFAQYTDTIYPMLYPSHYTNDIKRMSDPYFTVLEGINKAKQRISNTRIVAYIQGFNYKVSLSKLSLADYIKKQIEASQHSNGQGYIIWNAKNNYSSLYVALDALTYSRLKKKNKQNLSSKVVQKTRGLAFN